MFLDTVDQGCYSGRGLPESDSKEKKTRRKTVNIDGNES